MSVSNIVRAMDTATRNNALMQHQSAASISSNQETGLDLSVISYTTPEDGVMNVTFQAVASRDPSALEIAVAAGSLFRQEANIVPGTARVVRSEAGGRYIITAKVGRNSPKIAMAASGAPANFRMIARNLFMDDRDQRTWVLSDSGGSPVLIRNPLVETDTDLQELLTSCSNVTHQFTGEFRAMTASVVENKQRAELGAMLSFVSHSGQHSVGIVVSPDHKGCVGVLPFGDSDVTFVKSSAIVRYYDTSAIQDQIVMPEVGMSVSAGIPSVDAIVDYYRKLYGNNEEFFRAFEERIRGYSFL